MLIRALRRMWEVKWLLSSGWQLVGLLLLLLLLMCAGVQQGWSGGVLPGGVLAVLHHKAIGNCM